MHFDPFRTRTLYPPLHVFATDFDFIFRCTRTFPHSDPFSRPLHVLQLGSDNFDVLGHFPPPPPPHLHAFMHFKFRCTGTLPRILNVLMHSDPFPAPSIKSGNTIMSQRKNCVYDKINIFYGVVLMSFGVFCCGFVWFVVTRWTSRDFLNIRSNGGSIHV